MNSHKAIYNITLSQPFIPALARGLVNRFASNTGACLVLLPTQRSCRALAYQLRELNCTQLPTIKPLGDVIPDPEADTTPNLNRVMALMPWLRAYFPEPAYALYMANYFCKLWEEMLLEQCDWQDLLKCLPNSVPSINTNSADQARWRENLVVLQRVAERFPEWWHQLPGTSKIEQRVAKIQATINEWHQSPPATPIIIAGSTGSMPMTRNLIKTVRNLPQGAIVLAGLDQHLPETVWSNLHSYHPQAPFAALLADLECEREQVSLWLRPEVGLCQHHQVQGISYALHDQYQLAKAENMQLPLQLIVAPTQREEARAIVNLIKDDVLSANPHAEIAIITANSELRRYLSLELQQAGLDKVTDDSAVGSLRETPAAMLFLLMTELLRPHLNSVHLLAVLRHPLLKIKVGAQVWQHSELLSLSWQLESKWLRPLALHGKTWNQIRLLLNHHQEVEQPEVQLLIQLCDMARVDHDGNWWQAHRQCWQFLVNNHAEIHTADWAEFLELIPDQMRWSDLDQYIKWLECALTMKAYNQPSSHKSKPNIHLLKPLDARLWSGDVVILAGLNHDDWPQTSAPDPWLSERLRTQIGLHLHDRRIGLAALDFCQFFANPRIVLTRSNYQNPAVWWLKLTAVLGPGQELERALPLTAPSRVYNWPEPDREMRPQRFSLREVQRLLQDPYSFYLRNILQTQTPPPLVTTAAAQAKSWRQLMLYVAKILEDDGQVTDYDLLVDRIAPELSNFSRYQLKRVVQAAVPLLQHPEIIQCANNIEGKFTLELGPSGGKVTLEGTIDRLELHRDNTVKVIGYTSNTVPTFTDLVSGRDCMLLLQGIMLTAGGVTGWEVPPEGKLLLSLWRLRGTEPPVTVHNFVKADLPCLAQAEVNLRQVLSHFMTAPYQSGRGKNRFKT